MVIQIAGRKVFSAKRDGSTSANVGKKFLNQISVKSKDEFKRTAAPRNSWGEPSVRERLNIKSDKIYLKDWWSNELTKLLPSLPPSDISVNITGIANSEILDILKNLGNDREFLLINLSDDLDG